LKRITISCFLQKSDTDFPLAQCITLSCISGELWSLCRGSFHKMHNVKKCTEIEGDIWVLNTVFNFLYSMKSLGLDIHVKSKIEPSSVSSTCSWNASDVYNCVATCL
jgi:hypothetical protein